MLKEDSFLLKKYLRSRNVNINKKNIADLIEIVIDDLENNSFINELAGRINSVIFNFLFHQSDLCDD